MFLARVAALAACLTHPISGLQLAPARPLRRLGRVAAAAPTAAPSAAENPFELVRDDLKLMKGRIRALVERTLDSGDGEKSSSGKSHPLLQEAAREFFERRERAFRPCVVLLAARAVSPHLPADEAVSPRQCLLAEIVEMMSTAQLVHDSVLEDDEEGEEGNVAHRTYSQNAGNKISVLAGDFLLARCSVALSQLGDLGVVRLMATALESMVLGGVLKAQAAGAGADKLSDLDHYLERVSLKTSALIADACRSAAILGGEAPDGPYATAVYDYASALGVAYQLNADSIAYRGQVAEDAPLADALSAPPVILAAAADEGCRALIYEAMEGGATLAAVAAAVDAAGGAEAAQALSTERAAAAKVALAPLPESPAKAALLRMADFVCEPDQLGLQREKYIAAEAKKKAA